MQFPTIKTKKDSLYITLFFLFSIACIAGLRYKQRLEMQKGIAEKIIRFHVIANSDTKEDPEKYGGHEADGRESHCGERL